MSARRDRVLTALRNDRPDAVPVGFWGHNFAREHSAAELATETVERARAFDWDFVKIQSRASCFAECWGARWERSKDIGEHGWQQAHVVGSARDLDRIRMSAADRAPLEEQLEAVRIIRRELSDGRPLLMTVFSPLMTLPYLLREERDAGQRASALELLRSDAARTGKALDAIADLHAWFARACIEAGADGVFYATNMTGTGLATADEVERWEHRHAEQVLASVGDATFTMLHLCGAGIQFDDLAHLPFSSVSWAAGGPNPTLAEGRERSGHAVAGGISTGARLAAMTAEEAASEAEAAMAATGGRGLLLAPSCSIRRDTPEANLAAVTSVARREDVLS
jgi:uroporphyrinogen decarboxylase